MEKFKQLARHHGTKHKQFLLYGLIGVSGVVLDYIAFAVGSQLLGLSILVANFISISLGIVNNFWLNSKYNFKTTDNLLKRFGLFYVVGFLGIILSELLILVFHYGFGMGDLVAKLLTLPFVLVFQFFLNKHISFGDLKRTEKQFKAALRHWPLYVMLVVYAVCSLFFIAKLPDGTRHDPKNAPDENTHYYFNVDHIIKFHNLPKSGVNGDDHMAYELCGDRPIGQIPCLYSYTIYPGPNYIVSAVLGTIAEKTDTMSSRTGARFASFLAGLSFVTFLYMAILALTRRRLYATLITACGAFIPQVIFINSYVNLDAHSLAISAFAGWALVKFMLEPRRRLWQVMFCVAFFGLVPVAKYNYFVLFLPGIAAAIYVFVKHKFSRFEILRFALYAFIAFMVLASFWYIRNTILYHDPLGQTYMLNEMVKHHRLNHAYPINISSIFTLARMDFFLTLFQSFFAEYGSMVYVLDISKYTVIEFVLLTSVAYGGYRLWQFWRLHDPRWKLMAMAVSAFFVIYGATLFSVIYNSLKNDYQPQGRYMFPVIVPALLLLAYLLRLDDRRFRPILFAFAVTGAFLFIEGARLFAITYL